MALPAAKNPIDDNKQGFIGKPVDRVDGPRKVSGSAAYTYEFQPDIAPEKLVYGYLVGATVAKGKLLSVDASDAEKAPGVVMVMTNENAPAQASYGPPKAKQPLERAKPYLDSNDIRYWGEPIAFVVAETYEQARHAATLVKARYRSGGTPKARVADFKNEGEDPKEVTGGSSDSAIGDFDGAFASASVKVDATYTTPYQIHSAMELHSAMAQWSGDKLTIHAAHQLTNSAQKSIAKTLKIKPEQVHVINHYIGGGFGGKLPTEAEIILSALAARELQRPVKTLLTRQQTFANVYHRTESIQRVRLGADANGTLSAIGHDAFVQTATFDQNVENAATATRTLYAAPNRLTRHRVTKLDLPPSGAMRAPGEAIGLLCLEQAMDELAVALNIDPIELRLRNEPKEDPEKHIPFSTRALPRCMQEGARRFGWDQRPAKPGTRREGRFLIGYGMSAAIRPNLLMPSQAEVTLDAKGKLTAKMAMTDVGTGSYTILTQIAAEAMGLPLDAVTVLIGDSDYPPTPGSGGSWGANSAGSGLLDACMNLQRALAKAAVADKQSPLYSKKLASAEFADGNVTIGGARESFQAIAARALEKKITAKGKIESSDNYKKYSQAGYGAHFAEVAVDSATGEVRLRRMLGVFAAGRILNPKTARSQAIGGMLWGVSSALHEAAITDRRYGHFVNHDLAEYHVTAHADVGEVDAVYLDEIDDKTGPLKIKGVGELGICGAGAAVANAVYNACGVRVRDYPITLDKVLAGLA